MDGAVHPLSFKNGNGHAMKKISKPKMRTYQLLTLLAVLVPSVSSAEMAFTDMYVGGFGGAVFGVDAEGEAPLLVGNPSLDFDPDGQYALGLVFGARVAPNLRAEVELSYSNSDVDKTSTVLNVIAADGDLSSTSLLINGWYEFETNSSWRPYVGGGIGYTKVDADIDTAPSFSTFNDSDGGFSYQIGFGVTFPVGQSGTVDIGYRYRETPNLNLVSANDTAFDDIDFKSQTLQIGYNYRF
jgi:opacity protein-like surface antigen